jgi:hypothetical protein
VTDPDWTVLIATLGQRTSRFTQLLRTLLPQVDAYDGRVTVTALFNHGERPLGHVRQALLDGATSRYVSFVDDDDELPGYYVDEVLPLLDGVDYVGWQLQCYVDGVAQKPTFHSLRYRRWYEDRKGYYRDVSHLNPIRTELARRADFRHGEPPEDVSWVDQVRPHVKTEHYVDKVMYHYRSSARDSTWHPSTRLRRKKFTRPHVSSPYFCYHPEST